MATADAMKTVFATYVWIDDLGHLRSQYRCLEFALDCCNLVFPPWSIDGPASDVTLVPVHVVRDPFSTQSSDALLLCECLCSLTDLPTKYNMRDGAKRSFERHGSNMHPWFGITQEYLLCDADTGQPYMWKQLFSDTCVPKQTLSYCGVGLPHAIGRDVAVEHMRACVTAGLKVTGMHAGATPSQWAFQLAPLEGVKAADELWLARYILEIVCERRGLRPVWHPKPKKRFPGSACLVTYSNSKTREVDDGFTELMLIMNNLSKAHEENIVHYGVGNDLRLSDGAFTFGIGDRNASVRIPHRVFAAKCGHFEDRRPAANCDPYTVTKTLHETCIQI